MTKEYANKMMSAPAKKKDDKLLQAFEEADEPDDGTKREMNLLKLFFLMKMINPTTKSDLEAHENDKYKYEKVLGQGGQGKAYLVHNVETNQQSVIKRIYCYRESDIQEAEKEVGSSIHPPPPSILSK